MLADLWPSWRPDWVVYEDDDLLVIDKPAGMAVQASGDGADLLARLAELYGHLSLLHPLDSRMSGLVALSKRKEANRAVAEQLAGGVSRSYLALVARAPKQVEGFTCERVSRGDGFELLRLSSGARSQPVRRALAAAGAAAFGDEDNGGSPAARLMLHHDRMLLSHPSTGRELALEARDRLSGWRADPFGDDLGRRLTEAVDARYALARRGDTDAFRLVHGAGDALPGVEIDLYGEHAVVALRDEAERAVERLLDAVFALGVAGVYLKRRPRKASDVDPRSLELAPPHALRGADAPEPLVVHELGLPFYARLGDGLATGIFLDQRENRSLVRRLASGRSLLNLFGYTGPFTVAAAAGGAELSVTVDSSKAALERAADNLALLGADPGRHHLIKDDARRWLERASERFDVIVLDPPSFSTTKRNKRGAVFRVARDYRPLAAAAMRRLAPDGCLLACTNHRGIVAAQLRRSLAEAAGDAGIEVSHMRLLDDPSDFPPPPGEPCHLKSILVETSR